MRTTELAMAGVLSAFSIAIPFTFRGTPLQIYLPALQYSGTLASHVPSMLAIAVGPIAAVLVGLASTIGFAATLGPIVAARAFTHVIWGLAAAMYVRRGGSYVAALLLIALPIHSIGEGLIVFALGPIFGAIKVPAETAAVLVFAGTAVHHLIDSAISIGFLKVVKPLLLPLRSRMSRTVRKPVSIRAVTGKASSTVRGFLTLRTAMSAEYLRTGVPTPRRRAARESHAEPDLS